MALGFCLTATRRSNTGGVVCDICRPMLLYLIRLADPSNLALLSGAGASVPTATPP
jgi:hypothetical protein